MRKLYFLLISIMTSVTAMAQQDAQFSHYLFNQIYLNPGAAGSENVTRFQVLYRSQYLGYQGTYDDGGAPTSQLVSASIPLAMIKSGIGFSFVNDKVGAAYDQQFQLSYAYHLPLANGHLGLGVRGGLYSKGINYDLLRANDAGDPLLSSGKISQTAPDLALGAYYDSPELSLGLSVDHLNQPNYSLGTKDAKNTLTRNAYLTASKVIGLTYAIDLTPMFLLKTDLKTFSPELGAIATYNNKFYAGISYRWSDAATAMIGAYLLNNTMRIGYALDYVVVGTNAKSATSHEIMVSYAIAALRAGKKSIIRTPRYRY